MNGETVNRDPDGFECYSDHAEDIRYSGECSHCGSTDINVVGHVLPDVERVRGVDPVDAARQVVETATARIYDGVLLDHFTAQHIVVVADALSEANLAKLRAMSLAKAGTVCFKILARTGGSS